MITLFINDIVLYSEEMLSYMNPYGLLVNDNIFSKTYQRISAFMRFLINSVSKISGIMLKISILHKFHSLNRISPYLVHNKATMQRIFPTISSNIDI